MTLRHYPNPDLAVGDDNKQRWNQPAHRRSGFHNAHLLFRRGLMVRSRSVLELTPAASHDLAHSQPLRTLVELPAISALVVAEGNNLLFEHYAPDFGPDQPHSIQSVTKMHMHLIMGDLISTGLIDPEQTVAHYLPWIGTAYAGARVQVLLDMNVDNDFSEDYGDAGADCYREEEALGWRLPQVGASEITLRDFVAGLSGGDLVNRTGYALYKSANTDVLTLIAATVAPEPLARRIEAIADAAGYAGAFHISTSPDGHPAFSGGGCLTARDLVRFGLLIFRGGRGVDGAQVGFPAFTRDSLARQAPTLSPTRSWVRYSNHLMTNGRWLGHAGYGGQFLMVDMQTGRVAAFLSVLENPSGYDEDYISRVIEGLQDGLDS